MKFLRFKRQYQSGGMIGGGNITVTSKNISVFKPRKSGILLEPAPVAQFPTIDKSKIIPNLDSLFADLKGKGHTNEVNRLFEIKRNLDSQLQSLSDLDILGNSEKFQAIMNGYLQLSSPAMLNELLVSKERTKAAYEDGVKKGITGQYAVKEDTIIVKNNKNEIQRIPLDKLYEYQTRGYVPVSIQELNDLRDYEPSLAGQYHIDAFLNWGVNGEQLRSRIREVFAKVGHTLRSKEGKGFDFSKIGDSLYEITVEGGYREKKNASQLIEALNGLKRSLTQEELDTMKSNAAMYLIRKGLPTTAENISATVNDYLLSVLRSQEIDEAERKSGTSIGKDLSGGGNNRPAQLSLNEAEAVMGDPVTFDVTLPSGMTMHIRGSNIGHILYDQGPLIKGEGKNKRPLSVLETRINEMGDLNKSRIIGAGKDAKPVPPDQQFAIDPRSLVYTYTLRRKGTDKYLINEDSEIGKKYVESLKKLESQQKNLTPEQQRQQILNLHRSLQKELGDNYEIVPIITYKAVIPNAPEYRGEDTITSWFKSWVGGNPAFRELSGDRYDIYKKAAQEAYSGSTGVELMSNDDVVEVTMFAPARSDMMMRAYGQETKSRIEIPPYADDAAYIQANYSSFDRSFLPSSNKKIPTVDVFNITK